MRRGALIKQCRRREVEYEFVLLNDLLLYGTAVAGGGDASGAAAAGVWSIRIRNNQRPPKKSKYGKNYSFRLLYQYSRKVSAKCFTILSQQKCVRIVSSSHAIFYTYF